MFASVYCPNFYIQCERLFRPELRDQDLVIASQDRNGNSRVIASSAQAQTLGLIPGYQSTELAEIASNHKFTVCKPNYELYADLSDRFIKSLTLLAPNVSAYSSDEVFLELKQIDLKDHGHLNHNTTNASPVGTYRSYAEDLQETLNQWLGLSTVIGIAPTKTLAKLASNAALKFTEYHGIIDISSQDERRAILRRTSILDIPGVSSKAANKLSEISIQTALQLSNAPKVQVRRHCSVIIERIAIELSGLACKKLKVNSNDQDASPTTVDYAEAYSFTEVKRVLKHQVSNAVDRLVNISSLCHTVTISLIRVPHRQQEPHFQCALRAELSKASDSSTSIQQLANQLLESLWNDGYQYHALRLSLEDLSSATADQFRLFANETNRPVNNQLNLLPTKIDIETVLCNSNNGNWHPNRPFSSPSFTTQWAEIPRVS